MSASFVRAPNNPVLITAGMALLSLAASKAAVATANHYPMPMVVIGSFRDASLGIVLLIVMLRWSRFAGATAVIVATFLVFGIAVEYVTLLASEGSARLNWWTAVHLAIAGSLVGPSLFPWNSTANKPVLFWMALTIGAMTLLIGGFAILVRL